MTSICRAQASVLSALVLTGTLVACGGSSGGADASADGAISPTPTATATASPEKPPPPVYISLTPDDAAKAKRRLEGVPGVSHTRYAKGPERFWVYYSVGVTADQRRHVRHVIYSLLG